MFGCPAPARASRLESTAVLAPFPKPYSEVLPGSTNAPEARRPLKINPRTASRRLTHHASRSPPSSRRGAYSGFEGSRIESFIRLTIGYSYKLLLRAHRRLNRREPPGPKAALLMRPGASSRRPMKPSVASLAAPRRTATHPPTQPDDRSFDRPGTEARGFNYPRAFQRA